MIWLNRYTDTVYCIIRVTRLAAFIASGEMAVACFLTSFSGKNAQSHAERAGEIVADLEQGRAAGAVLFYVFC